MSAPKDNQFWKARSKHGRDKIFSTPEILWEAACEYFEWVKDNPLYTYEVIKSGQEAGRLLPIPLMRAMTIEGLCIFLDVGVSTFDDYSRGEVYKDFSEVTKRIRDIIRTQKFEGASAGMLNANIIARDLGLSDKQELDANIKIPDINLNYGKG